MKFLYLITLMFSSFYANAKPEYILTCDLSHSDKDLSTVNYIIDSKNSVAEILYSQNTEVGILDAQQHFYTLYFTRNAKTLDSTVTTIIINRISGELTKTTTSKLSYPKIVGKKITGTCKTKDYKRIL